jgi:hypothetical protein
VEPTLLTAPNKKFTLAERIRRNIYALEAIELAGLSMLLVLVLGLIGISSPSANQDYWSGLVITTLCIVPAAGLALWGLYLLQLKILIPLPVGCLIVGVIVASLVYGAGIIMILLISLFDLNRQILSKSLYLGDAPVEYFWSPRSRVQHSAWNQRNKTVAARRNTESLVQSRDVERLINVLQTGSSQQRAAAAEALGTLGDPRAVQPLIIALQHKSLDLSVFAVAPKIPYRVAAAAALGQLGDVQAVEPLIDVLQNKGVAATALVATGPVQAAAAAALGQLGDPRALDPLSAAIRRRRKKLDPYYEQVRTAAVAALEKLRQKVTPQPTE